MLKYQIKIENQMKFFQSYFILPISKHLNYNKLFEMHVIHNF